MCFLVVKKKKKHDTTECNLKSRIRTKKKITYFFFWQIVYYVDTKKICAHGVVGGVIIAVSVFHIWIEWFLSSTIVFFSSGFANVKL